MEGKRIGGSMVRGAEMEVGGVGKMGATRVEGGRRWIIVLPLTLLLRLLRWLLAAMVM